MKLNPSCSACGIPLPQGVHGKQCPACLLRSGMAAEAPPPDSGDYLDGMEEGGSAACSIPREAPGTMIGRYRLLQEIGEGGFGIVYLAEQTDPVKRRVALKLLKPGMDTREVIARFEAERQALAVMDHPNIARVYDGGATGSGRPFFVMELVAGTPLTRYCDDHRFSIRQRLELFLDVISAVQHAHQKGIIHRDLKPSNILAGEHDGKPVIKVIDFGIAKALSTEQKQKTHFTGIGQLIGTPQYMSPEQAEINAHDVDTRSDIYSLGAVLYELLTGRTPLDSRKLPGCSYIEMQQLIRTAEPAKPSAVPVTMTGGEWDTAARQRQSEPWKLAALLRGDLDWVVMKALEKNRSRRYQTANGLGLDIRRFLQDEPVSASPPSTTYRFLKFAKRHRFGVAWTVVVSLIVLTAAIGMTLLYFQAGRETKIARRQEWEARMSEISALRLSGKSGSLDALKRAAAIPGAFDVPENVHRMRNAAIASLAIAGMKEAETWQGNPGYGDMVSADRELTSYACTFPNGRIAVHGLPGHNLIAELPGDGRPVNWVLRFSPGGRRLAAGYGTASEWALKLWEVRSDSSPRDAGTGCYKAFDFLPGGDHYVLGRANGDQGIVELFDITSGHSVRQFQLSGVPHSISVNRDGKLMAVSLKEATGQPGGIVIIDMEKGTVLHRLQVPMPRALAWSPAEDSLAAGSMDSMVRIWHGSHAAAGLLELKGHTAAVDGVAWSQDGRLLASDSWDGSTMLWDPFRGVVQSSHFGRGSGLCFSPDSTRLGILIEGSTLTVLEVTPGDVCYRARGHDSGQIHGSAWNREETLMATSGDDGVRIWNRAGRHLAFLNTPNARGLAFLPDSLLIASASGLSKWPVRAEITGKERVAVFGEPSSIGNFYACEHMAMTTNGPLLALVGRQRTAGSIPEAAGEERAVWLLDLNQSRPLRRLSAPQGVTFCAISPDNHWLAAGTWHGNGVRVWSLPDAKAPVDLPVSGSATVAFSLAGQWLVTGDTEAYRFWKTGSWELDRQIPSQMGDHYGAMAFSPRKTAITIACRRSELKVLHPLTLEELAAPDFDQESPLCFDPSGLLMVNTGHGRGILFWKLDTVRARLKEMGLDWPDLPKFPPSTAPLVDRAVILNRAP